MEGGRGARAAKTSECAGGSNALVSGSMQTGSFGAVGSIKSGNLQWRYSWERY